MLENSLSIRNSSFGKGISSSRSFSLGDRILTFTGPLISFEQTVKLEEKECYPLQIGRKLYIDIEAPGRFVNHSCEPNTGIQNTKDLIALRNIIAGEEIFYDYSTSMDEDHWTMACTCGSASCRGIVTDFKYLPLALQRKYLSLGVVQPYIMERVLPTFFKRVL